MSSPGPKANGESLPGARGSCDTSSLPQPSVDTSSVPPTTFPMMSPASSVGDTNSMHRRGSAYDEFARRDSVTNIRRQVEGTRKASSNVHVFQEEPIVRVLGGRSEDAWPARYVEYDVQLQYKGFTWQVEIAKSTIYGLFFFVKSHMHGQWNADAQTGSLHSTWNTPQIRRLFFANAEKSVRPDMVALVQQYLDAVVKIPALLHTSYVAEMFQVSCSTFDEEQGHTSTREGWLRVRMWTKGNQENVRVNRSVMTCDNEMFNCMCVVKRVNFRAKRWRWVALKDSSLVAYESIADTCATEVFLFDEKFTIERGVQSAGSSTALLVSNSTFVMQLEAKTKPMIVKWANEIRKAAENTVWAKNHRDGSFAVPRHPNEFPSFVKWFVDGDDAYASIHSALLSARKEIFIAGWWICPTVHLLRPAALYPKSRLDLVLERKAKEGVKVYVLMYKEVSVALTLNSHFAKMTLRNTHPNIFVLRDPDFLMKHLGMWSHHEKIVSVDQQVSFVGGLDLCFGRWDTAEHALFDNPSQLTNFVGKDYSNPRVKDFVEVNEPEKDLVDRTEVPRMPWHDCHCRLEGQPARDVARHFIQRWNYSISTRRKSSKMHKLAPMNDYPRQEAKPKTDDSSNLLTKRLQRAVRAVRAVQALRRGSMAQAEQKPRSPSKRQSLGALSPTALAALQRGGNEITDRLSPSSSQRTSDFHQARSASQPSNLYAHPRHLDLAPEVSVQAVETRGYAASCQILRSLSLWSGGCPTEASIQNAYIRLINSARHFIYIENQFFVSGLDGDPLCCNRIANAILERIRRAARNHEQLRVMVVMPLLPAFQGKVEDREATGLRGVMHWQYRTICRDRNSLYQKLFEDGIEDPFEYLAFYALRTHTVQHKPPQTEQVYVHSKVMIVDDRSTIIGSANVNDRSMAGDRDSEIAVLVDDTELDESIKMADGTFSVGKFGHSFRMQLFKEHFGVLPNTPQYRRYEDPVNLDTWLAMEDHGMKNSMIYDSVFGCLPSDSVLTMKQANQRVQRCISMRDPGIPSSPKRTLSARAEPLGDSPGLPCTCSPSADKHAGIDEAVEEAQIELEEQLAADVDDPERNEPAAVANEAAVEGVASQGERSAFFRVATLNMRPDAQIVHHQDELRQIQGHIVYFPLNFLKHDVLEPKLIPPAFFQ